MRIAVVGTGYVGLVTAACFAELGHDVTGVDIDAAKVKMLQRGTSPIYEPGLEELLQRGLRGKRLRFTTRLATALPGTKVLFSAVATPPGRGASADLRAVFAVAETVATYAENDLVFVNKSTVPVGTGRKCETLIAAKLRARRASCSIPVISNPEFLREGMAVSDTMMPERIIVGINGDLAIGNGQLATGNKEISRRKSHAAGSINARALMEEMYRPITRVGKPIVWMNRESAEIVKYASNAFLATKISFINMLTELCEKTGANIRSVATGMGLDSRIGARFLHAGIGYGGSCFPKDVKALLATAKEHKVPMPIAAAADEVNARQRARFIAQILRALPARSRVAVWGLSFKPKTDDMREAPSLDVVVALRKAGHRVSAYDPVATERAKPLLPRGGIQYAHSPIAAARGADAVILLTEWDVLRGVNFAELRRAMKGRDLFDGRNVYDPKDIADAGLVYHGIGI